MGIVVVFNGSDKQNYTFSIFPTRNIPENSPFTVEVIKKNLRSVSRDHFNYSVLNALFHSYIVSCLSSEYYEVHLKQCFSCNEKCLECKGPTYYECTKCNKNILDGVCVSECPLGYTVKSSKCHLESTVVKIVYFNFEGAGNIFYDQTNNIKATGFTNSTKRHLTDILPFPVYLRGAYFPGQSALKIEFTNQHLLSSTFTFSLWIKPESPNAELITKITANNTFLTISLENFYPMISLEMDGIIYKTLSNSILSLNWNHIFISLDASLGISISVNIIKETPNYLNNTIFVDSSNSTLYIGSDSLFQKNYKGFIFNIEIYTGIPNIIETIISQCPGCDFCPVSGKCIPHCNIGEFYDVSKKICSNCPNECPDVCRSSDSCDLCIDDFCTSCSSYKEKSCLECSPNYEVIDNLCSLCKSGFYYSYKTLHCESCVGLCETCSSEILCLTCKENSSFITPGECACNLGYSFIEKCERNLFTAIIMISQENIASLIFNETLVEPLQRSQIDVFIDDKKVKFALSSDDKSKFYINPEIPDDVNKLSRVKITVVIELVSWNNALLKDKTFEASLFISDEFLQEMKIEAQAKAAKALAKTGSVAGVSAALGVGFMNFDPTSLFDFLNTAEMYYAVYLMNITLNKVLEDFLIGLRVQDMLPNVYFYTVSEDEGVEMPEKFKKLGFKSNLLLINGGGQLTSLTIIVVLLIFILFFSRFNSMKSKLEKFRQYFKFKVFLRFWLQTYFELAILSTFGLSFNEFANPTQIADAIICFIVIVMITQFIQTFMILFMIYILLKRRMITDENTIKEFESKYGTFFDEFKATGIIMWMFYVLYIFRRVTIVLSYLYINDGYLQLSFCLCFSLVVLFI